MVSFRVRDNGIQGGVFFAIFENWFSCFSVFDESSELMLFMKNSKIGCFLISCFCDFQKLVFFLLLLVIL